MLVGHSMSDANGLLLTMDPAVESLLQRPLHELVGKSYAEITHPDDRARNVDQIKRLLPGDGIVKIRKRYLRPSGTPIWADLHVSRLGRGLDNGRLVCTLYLPDPKSLAPEPVGVLPERLWSVAIQVEALIRRRRDALGEELFGDHAWLLLIRIYLAEAEGRVIDIATLARETQFAPPRARRWVDALAEKQLVDQLDWGADAIQLTALGLARTEALLGSYSEFH